MASVGADDDQVDAELSGQLADVVGGRAENGVGILGLDPVTGGQVAKLLLRLLDGRSSKDTALPASGATSMPPYTWVSGFTTLTTDSLAPAWSAWARAFSRTWADSSDRSTAARTCL